MFSFKEHKRNVKMCWMMVETRNPQFVIACSPVSSAFGVLCSIFAFQRISTFSLSFYTVSDHPHIHFANSDYKWALKYIVLVQSFGVVVGSIAPFFRFFTSIGHYSFSKKWSKNQLNVFRVEKHWTQTLQQWKRSHIHSQVPGHRFKIVSHKVKNIFLDFCIALHIRILIICKIICLIPRAILILLSCCWHLFKLCLKRSKMMENASTSNVSTNIEEYTRYAVIEEDAKLSNRILRNTLHSIIQLLDTSERKGPQNLVKLLEISTGFNGVVKFDNDQVPPLYPKETHNS
ncbi:hypothetical protein HanIR_Chr11g0556321 [Helianthus annuus]|nr:hypothetical protein HanIR_Chr11g0556321 [Helianthus annuus]